MGLFGSKRTPAGPPRPYPDSFAGWEAPITHATIEDSLELQETFEALFTGFNVEDINGAEYDDWAYLVRDRHYPEDYASVCVWIAKPPVSTWWR